MEFSAIGQQELASVQQALGIAVLRNAMNQSPQVVDKLLQGMEEVSTEVMEKSVNPNLGVNLDVRV